MIDWREARTLEHRDSSLGFAVRLVDAFTGERPTGDVTVALEEVPDTPVRNPSGYHVFQKLPVETVTLVVDGGERYFEERRRVRLPEESSTAPDEEPSTVGDSDQPASDDEPSTVVLADRSEVVVVELTPTPAYRFPESATLVRGHVEDADGEPVEGATVTLRGFDVETWTTGAGEYALFVPVTSEDVVRENGRKYVRVDGRDAAGGGRGVANGGTGRDPTLAVSHPSYPGVEERIEVEAGTDTVRYVTLGG